MSTHPLNAGNGILSNATKEMVVSKDELDSTEHHHVLLTGVAVSVASCIIVAFVLISCIYFRKWKYRRRPAEDAAFYTNAGFDDFPHGPSDLITAKKLKQDSSTPEVYPNNAAALYNLSDLPPHPAAQFNKPYPLPYQLDPEGYVEQNLYASRSPKNSPQRAMSKNNGGIPSQKPVPNNNLSQVHPTAVAMSHDRSHDIMFSNPGAKDKDFTQKDERVDSVDGVESGYETIDLGETPDENQDGFVLANPAAFKEYV
ncbi:uncharacterized protein [Amphiura filiformis]|uniref:uncharacterized protein n=1 Tax=Amphiura filiformis TaxID=82378 RepID=UPI003B21C290